MHTTSPHELSVSFNIQRYLLKWTIPYSENLLSFFICIRLEKDYIFRRIPNFVKYRGISAFWLCQLLVRNLSRKGFDFVKLESNLGAGVTLLINFPLFGNLRRCCYEHPRLERQAFFRFKSKLTSYGNLHRFTWFFHSSYTFICKRNSFT